MALQKPLAVTPFIGYRFPTQDYPTFGHASHGRHLRELRIGCGLARNLRPILLEAYVLGTYSYSFVERFEDFTFRTHTASAELGYFVHPRVSVRAVADYSRRTGGSEGLVLHVRAHPRYEIHDIVWNERRARVGGGGSFSLNQAFDVFALVSGVVWGENSEDGISVTTAINWNFITRLARQSE